MKLALIGLVVAMAWLCGCAATGGRDVVIGNGAGDTNRSSFIADLAELAAYDGTIIHLGKKPRDRGKFEQAARELELLEQTKKFDPLSFALVMRRLGVKELGSERASLVIGNVVFLYERRLKQLTPLEQPEFVGQMVKAVRAGLVSGLEYTFPAPTEGHRGTAPPARGSVEPRPYHWSWSNRNVAVQQ